MICRGCSEDKETTEFPERKDRSGRLRPYCRECANEIERVRYSTHRKLSPFKHKCVRVKYSAASKGIPYDLTPEYLESIWTGFCPILGAKIEISGDRYNETVAELDRFIPSKGYVKGNVTFISRRANRFKNNATTEEIRKLLGWMESYGS